MHEVLEIQPSVCLMEVDLAAEDTIDMVPDQGFHIMPGSQAWGPNGTVQLVNFNNGVGPGDYKFIFYGTSRSKYIEEESIRVKVELDLTYLSGDEDEEGKDEEF